MTGVGKELSQTLVWTAKNLRTKVMLQNMPVVAKVDEKTIWYRLSQDLHPNCHNLLHSVQVIENAWNGCKVLSQIHRYHNCQRNEWNSVSQCTRICSSVQSGDRNLCYAAAIRGMSGHKEQIGNNPSKYWFECFNCTFKLYAFFYFIHWHFCTLKNYSWKDNGQIWDSTTSNLTKLDSNQVPSRHQASGYTPPLLKLLKIRFFKGESHICFRTLNLPYILEAWWACHCWDQSLVGLRPF